MNRLIVSLLFLIVGCLGQSSKSPLHIIFNKGESDTLTAVGLEFDQPYLLDSVLAFDVQGKRVLLFLDSTRVIAGEPFYLVNQTFFPGKEYEFRIFTRERKFVKKVVAQAFIYPKEED